MKKHPADDSWDVGTGSGALAAFTRGNRSQIQPLLKLFNGTMHERLAVLMRICRHPARRLHALKAGMYLIGCAYNFYNGQFQQGEDETNMRNIWCHLRHSIHRQIAIIACLLIIISGLLGSGFLLPSDVTYADGQSAHVPATDCDGPEAHPDPQSLLVVLLDRSGSLIEGSKPTDPNGYSTSVTKALADLWLGRMAVIPFSGDTTSLPILGPSTVADRTAFKSQIQDTAAHIGGDTPLAPAMQEALNLLLQNGNPPGSRVVIITDGNPTGINDSTGPDQERQIRAEFIPQFCQHDIPVSAFGLEINTGSANGQDANRLLTDITNGTNATYTDVTSPEQLSQVVISLYAQWQGLNFTKEQAQGGNFYVAIDNLAQQATIVTFRTSGDYAITLTDPNGHHIGSPLTTDTHYEIDNLNTAGPLIGGNYTVNVSADPNAQVYVLVKSSVNLHLLQPTSSTRAYANQFVQIQAEFFNGTTILTPKSGDGQIIAYITLLVNGRQASSNDVVLAQQNDGAIFSGKTIVFNQPGQLHIELRGNYQQSKLETSFDLLLLKPPLPPCNFDCQLQQHETWLIVGGSVLLLVLLAFLWLLWLLRRGPRPKLEGYITNGKPGGDLNLADFKSTRVTYIELETRGSFNFGNARFELLQQPAGGVLIRTLKGNNSKVCIDGDKPGAQIDVTDAGVEIRPSCKIYIDKKKNVSYEVIAGRRWT